MSSTSTSLSKTLFFLFCISVILFGCTTMQNSLAIKNETVKLKVDEKEDVLNYASLDQQKIPSMADRMETSRGLPLTPMLGGAISLASDLIKKVIAKDRAKYMANYSVGLTDMYFYDQLSTESAFDPVGMQFNGFTVVRTFTNADGRTDTALTAKFLLDKRHPYEIINNSIFRLQLEDLHLNNTRVKITSAQKKTINMDFEIIFNTSYVNEQGTLFKDVELGRFYFLLRDMPVDKAQPGYQEYYNNLKGQSLDGKCFIIPRSFGYYVAGTGKTSKSFSQGAYSITVNLKESAKDKFVTKIIADNSEKLIDLLGEKAKQKLNQQ